jgi:phospholipid/cholesterol/gamma-HCH transport system permease protein
VPQQASISDVRVLSLPLEYLLFLGQSLSLPWNPRRDLPRFLDQLWRHGVMALPVVLLTGAFVGLTTSVQTGYQLLGLVPKYFVGMSTGRMLLMELGPVFCAFVVAGRSASAMAAELGAMRVSEQIDALTVMGVNPHHFLCMPRIFATTVSVPLLTVVMEVVAIVTAVMVASFMGVSPDTFWYGLLHFVVIRDFVGGILKALVFGLLIGGSGCFMGFRVQGGAEAVGGAATRAVVLSAVLVLAFDFVVAVLMFRI